MLAAGQRRKALNLTGNELQRGPHRCEDSGPEVRRRGDWQPKSTPRGGGKWLVRASEGPVTWITQWCHKAVDGQPLRSQTSSAGPSYGAGKQRRRLVASQPPRCVVVPRGVRAGRGIPLPRSLPQTIVSRPRCALRVLWWRSCGRDAHPSCHTIRWPGSRVRRSSDSTTVAGSA
jgi:hypothetical protein